MGNEDNGGSERADVHQRIAQLHETAAELQRVSEETAVYDAMIDAAVKILGFDWCSIALPVEGRFELVRVSETAPLQEGERTMRTDEGVSGRTFQNGESIIVDNAGEHGDAKPVNESITSALSVPLEDRGVFQGYSSDVGAFDESDRRVGELLAVHTAVALERIERERELKRKNEQLEEFASIVSHDLRNPLNVAELQLELAAENHDSDHIESATDALSRMDELVEELLTLARKGQRVHDPEPVDLTTMVERCWDTVETGDAVYRLETDCTVRADPSSLQQLFENFVRNSVEHGSTNERRESDEPLVTITVGELGDEEGFYVADDGPGIPVEERDRVFESGYSTSDTGTGFGLAIVRKIADAHGWDVRIAESDAGGARFEITDVEVV